MSRGRPTKYPWDTMEVGEDFVCSAKFSSARVMASTAGKKYGKKFKVFQGQVSGCPPTFEVFVERVA